MWLAHFLPLRLLAVLGEALGLSLYVLSRERRRVTETNLARCFLALPPDERAVLARRHFRAFGRSFLERGILWWSSRARIMRLVRLEGAEHLRALAGRPVILLAPHFVGLDMGWTRLTCEFDLVSIYANQKNFYFNAALRRGRERFGRSRLLSRQQGVRPAIRAMHKGLPFYYLPDMDYGQRDTIFVPFFGVPAATITGLSRLVRMTGATVLSCVTQMLPNGDGYIVRIGAPWPGFPGASIEGDTRRMNQSIETEVQAMVEQYFWLHKRFKTRPPGARPFYTAPR